MTTFKLNGVPHATPFATLFRLLTDEERSGLKASIAEYGLQSPIHIYQSEKWGGSIINGLNRIDICNELQVTIPESFIIDHGKISDTLARALAFTLQADGRQLTRNEIEEARKKRIEYEVEARANGKSFRVIAKEVGRNEKTVRNDLVEAK
jgi:ParB-like chromosome segregation protein Spo0J